MLVVGMESGCVGFVLQIPVYKAEQLKSSEDDFASGM